MCTQKATFETVTAHPSPRHFVADLLSAPPPMVLTVALFLHFNLTILCPTAVGVLQHQRLLFLSLLYLLQGLLGAN